MVACGPKWDNAGLDRRPAVRHTPRGCSVLVGGALPVASLREDVRGRGWGDIRSGGGAPGVRWEGRKGMVGKEGVGGREGKEGREGHGREGREGRDGWEGGGGVVGKEGKEEREGRGEGGEGRLALPPQQAPFLVPLSEASSFPDQRLLLHGHQ